MTNLETFLSESKAKCEAATLDQEHIDILRHTVSRAANRHYCGDSKHMKDLCELGFMKSIGRKSFVPDEYFAITRNGISALARADAIVAKGE